MSLFFGSKPETRAVTGAEWMSDADWSAASRTKSGESVTLTKALRVGAMWSSANLLASIVSNLPVDVHRGSGASKTPVTPQPRFIATPSLKVTRREWVYQAMMSMLLRGNAYGYILERDSLARPVTVEWLNPDDVHVTESTSLSQCSYTVGGDPVNREDILHMRAFLRPGSAVGMSPVSYHAEALGMGLSAQAFGARFFGDGAIPSAIFKNNDKTINPADAADVKARLMSVLRKKREPLVIGKDWSYEQIQVSPNESQFIETLGYTDTQIARLYGPGLAEILGYGNSGSSLTYSNRVDRSLDLLTYGVLTWVNKFEDMWTANIAQPQTARMNVSSLLRVDPKSQREIFKTDREIGLHSIDEIRDLLDESPLPDGQGADYTPLKSSPPQSPSTGANG